MELNVTASIPAVQVHTGDYVVGFAGAVLLVNEVRHRTVDGDAAVRVTLMCWPSSGPQPAKRSTLEYDDGHHQRVTVLPSGPVGEAVWAHIVEAVGLARGVWADAQEADNPGAQVAEASPWDTDVVHGNTVITLHAAGRTWVLGAGPLPNEHIAK